MSAITGDVLVQGGAVGVLAFVALMVFMGWLIPVRIYRTLERDRDYWRTVALTAVGQAQALLPAAQITTEMTRALSDAATGERAAMTGPAGEASAT